MGYIGRGPVKSGAFRIIDDVSSSFNGSTTAFTLQSSSSNITPGTEQNLLIAVDGVVQEPQSAFTISGSTLTFTSAPASGATFWGVELGDVGGVASTVANETVGTTGLTADAVTNAKLANMAANTVKVNATTGSANPTDVSMASANLSGAIADGDVLLIYDASTTSLKTVAKSVLVAGIGGDFSNNGDAGPLTLGTTDSTSLTLETNNTARMVIASGGQVTMPTQPAFCAYLSANATNVTGNGAVYIMGAAGDAGGGMTEDFDRGGNFSTSNFKFVAPVAGIYYFHAQAYVAGFASSPYVIAPAVRIYKGNTDWGFGGTVDTAGDMISSGRVRVSLMLELAVDDEITARITATNGGSNLVDVQGGSSPRSTWFMGYLVA